MLYYDTIHSKKIVVSILLILFVQQSTSKSKRSKKDPVIHVTRRQSDATEDPSVTPTVFDDVEALTKLIGMHSDTEVTSRGCPPRCATCDPVNGCTQCRSRTFLFLAEGRRHQTGKCLHDCPEGYFEHRGMDKNTCKKCQVSNCASCFVENYCTTCKEGFYLHNAKCVKTCPKNMASDAHTNTCVEKVDCEVGAWSAWSKCARRSPSRSCKYGRKKRTRVTVQEPSENGKQCPKLKETKRCKTPANKCPLINKWLQRQLRRQNRKKNRKGRKGRNKKNRKEISSNDTQHRSRSSGEAAKET